MSTTLILGPNNHAGGGTQTLVGEKFAGDGYYGASDGLHTFEIKLTGFIGKIKIQASLAQEPFVETDWFDADVGNSSQTIDTTGLIQTASKTTIEYTDAETSVNAYNVSGNLVWVRAYIFDWTDGSIESIKMNR
jgi:hypothetical protein